jgi:hypothetical protein
MSTLLVNKIKSVTGDTVTISGSNIIVQGKTTLGDTVGTDTVRVFDDMNLSGSLKVSGSEIVLKRSTFGGATNQIEFDSNGVVFDLAQSNGVKFNSNVHVSDGDVNVSGSVNLSGSFKFTPNISQLPTSDPGVSGQVFITGSTGMNLGGITGSGTFKILCVSAG